MGILYRYIQGNKSTKNKLKKLEYNIKNIFSNLKFKDQEDRYVYWVNVDENSTKETYLSQIGRAHV